MKILAVDTTESVCAAAITENKTLIASATLNTGNTHSETLLPLIDALLVSSGLSLDKIDLLAAAVGPGSFTGVRIGAASVKGLALPRAIPCVGVPSLDALAAQLTPFAGLICPVIDARRDQYYTALFRSNGRELQPLYGERLMTKDDLVNTLGASEEPLRFVGSGYEKLHAVIASAETPETLRYENAVSVAACAYDIYNRADETTRAAFTAENLTPDYLRPSQAERDREDSIRNAFLGGKTWH